MIAGWYCECTPSLLVALSTQSTSEISIWPGEKKAFTAPRSNLSAPSWGNMHPYHKKRRPGRTVPWGSTSAVTLPFRVWASGSSFCLPQCWALLPRLFSTSIPAWSTCHEAATASQLISRPAHFLSKEMEVPGIFLISKVPRDKRSYHKILNSFWKQKRDCWTCLQGGGAIPDMHTCVFLPHKGEGNWENRDYIEKHLSSSFLGVACPFQTHLQ